MVTTKEQERKEVMTVEANVAEKITCEKYYQIVKHMKESEEYLLNVNEVTPWEAQFITFIAQSDEVYQFIEKARNYSVEELGTMINFFNAYDELRDTQKRFS